MSSGNSEFSPQRNQGRRASDYFPSGEMSTLQGSKDLILRWALGIMAAGLLAAIGLLLDIRVSMAVYQADAKAVKDRVDKLEGWTIQHDRDVKTQFQEMGKVTR